jgi:hypothetical protein
MGNNGKVAIFGIATVVVVLLLGKLKGGATGDTVTIHVINGPTTQEDGWPLWGLSLYDPITLAQADFVHTAGDDGSIVRPFNVAEKWQIPVGFQYPLLIALFEQVGPADVMFIRQSLGVGQTSNYGIYDPGLVIPAAGSFTLNWTDFSIY